MGERYRVGESFCSKPRFRDSRLAKAFEFLLEWRPISAISFTFTLFFFEKSVSQRGFSARGREFQKWALATQVNRYLLVLGGQFDY